MIYFVDDSFVAKEDAHIHVSDISILRGCGVFEFFVTYNKIPFCLDDHLDRFFHSASVMQLQVPYKREEIKEIIFQLIEKNPYPECGIKLILTGGESDDDFLPKARCKLIALVREFKRLSKTLYENGIALRTTTLSRSLPSIKTTDYIPAIIAVQEAKKTGFFDTLFLDRENNLLECSRSNFFAVINNQLITPKENILAGITRKYIMDHHPVIERSIHIDEISQITEAFTTSSTKEALPISQIDQHIIGKPGPITKTIQALFNKTQSPSHIHTLQP